MYPHAPSDILVLPGFNKEKQISATVPLNIHSTLGQETRWFQIVFIRAAVLGMAFGAGTSRSCVSTKILSDWLWLIVLSLWSHHSTEGFLVSSRSFPSYNVVLFFRVAVRGLALAAIGFGVAFGRTWRTMCITNKRKWRGHAYVLITSQALPEPSPCPIQSSVCWI